MPNATNRRPQPERTIASLKVKGWLALPVLALAIYLALPRVGAFRDSLAGYAGVVVDRGRAYTTGSRKLQPYIVLRKANGQLEKRFVSRRDYGHVATGDSVAKAAGPFRYVRVLSKTPAEVLDSIRRTYGIPETSND